MGLLSEVLPTTTAPAERLQHPANDTGVDNRFGYHYNTINCLLSQAIRQKEIMPKDLVTAEEVRQAIMHRITSGVYMPGDRLPSVRQLAQEIGSNRNTVNKAYQMLLDLGVIASNSSGRRGFSVKNVPQFGQQSKGELLEYFYHKSVDLVWQGMAAGITSDEMFDQLKAAYGEVYGQSEVRLIFFECNEQDVIEMGQGLIDALEMPVEVRLLGELYSNLAKIVNNYDLIITTFHHLAEIVEALEEHGESSDQVVGIETRPTSETMLKVARLPNPHIGLVCSIQTSVHMLKHIFYGYHPEWEIEATTCDHPETITEIAHKCDHLIVTHTCAAEVTELTGRSPDVVVNFHIVDQSISFLKQRIHHIQLDKMKHLQVLSA
jgi:DNA-binding transcriptional regulator YhcF (GntR family)